MPQRITSNSFVGGEISPDLHGRHDLAQYFKGAKSISNMVVRRTGGVRKRPGTDHLFRIEPDAGGEATMGNKYKAFDFFNDATSFGLLFFRLTVSGEAQAKFFAVNDGTPTSTSWAGISVDLDIADPAQFDAIRCKQIGDTMFFTRSGMKSFKAVVTFADPSVSFEMVPNDYNVEMPYPMTATGSGFGTTPGNYVASPKTYAIWGVKDGVYSKPYIVTTGGSGATAVSLPWNAGAKVTLAGTLDFAIHDYYVVGKKTGVNFGKISEIYPQESYTEVAATIPASPANDLAYRSSLFGNDPAFNESAALLFSGNPLKKATDSKTVYLTPNCMAIKTTEFTESGETWYRCATPIYDVTVPSGAGYLQGIIACSNQAVSCPDFSAKWVGLYGTSGLRITPVYWSALDIVSGDVQTVSADGSGVARVGISGDGRTYVSFIIESKNAKMADCLFLGKVGIYSVGLSNFIQISRVVDPNTYIAGGSLFGDPFGDPAWGPWAYPAFVFGHEADVAARIRQLECNRVAFGKYEGSPVSVLWNKHSLADTAIAPGMATGSEWANLMSWKKENMRIAESDDFHANASVFSELYFNVAGTSKLSSISIHFGAHAATLYGRCDWPDASDYETATLYGKEGSEWIAVGTWSVRPRYLKQSRLTIAYPDTLSDNATEFKLAFTAPAIVRGIDLATIVATFSFDDDNLLPGTISGIQEMLTVGDEEMDAGLVDVVQQRLVFSTSEDEPFTLWFSAVGDLYNFYANRPQTDADAFSVMLPATRASSIRHILSGRDLLLFTEDGVYSCSSGNGEMFSYRTASIKKICGAAAHPGVAPIDVDGKVLFVGDDGRTVYELRYTLAEDAVLPFDRSVFAAHLTEGKSIVKMAYQRFPESVVWFLLEDGTLASMTYMPDQEVYAWAHHAIGGPSGKYRIAAMFAPGSKTVGEDVETTTDLLLLYEVYSGDDLQAHAVLERMRPNVCATTVATVKARCIDHAGTPLVEGETGTSADETVVESSLVTLRPETPDVSTQGIPKRILDVCLRVHRTGQIGVKPYDTALATMFLTAATVSAPNVALATRDIKIVPRGYVSDDGQLRFESLDQWPCEILSVVYTLDWPT